MSFQKKTSAEVTWESLVLGGLMVVGLCLRLVYVVQIESPPFSDMADYETMALNLLEGRGMVMDTPHLVYQAYRPPAYPFFIAAVYKMLGVEPRQVRIVQCFLSTLTIAFVYLLGYWIFLPFRHPPPDSSEGISLPSDPTPVEQGRARKIGLIGAALFSFEETSIFFCGQLLSETLFIFLMVGWSAFLVGATRRPGVLKAILLGLIAGVTILTRPIFGPLVLFGAVWFFYRTLKTYNPPPRDWARFSFFDSPYAPPPILLLYAGVVVFCWSGRNLVVTGSFVPVSTNNGVNFYLGHHEDFSYGSFGNKEGIRAYLRSKGIEDEVVESRFFQIQGLKFIRNHPRQELVNNLKKVYYLYLAPATWKSALNPTTWWSYLESPYRPWPWESKDRKVRFWRVTDESGRPQMPTYRDWFWNEGRLPLVHWGWPVIYLTLLGLVLACARREKIGFLVGILLFYTLTMLVYFTNSRFRTPLLPFLYLFAGYAIAAFWDGIAGYRGKSQARVSGPIEDTDSLPSSPPLVPGSVPDSRRQAETSDSLRAAHEPPGASGQ